MSVNRGVTLGVILMVVVASTGLTRPLNDRMFPAFTMFRGDSLENPLLLYHANVTADTSRGVVVADVSHDLLVTLYSTLVASEGVTAGDPRIAYTYEVAEFFGPQWLALAGPDGRPTRTLRFEEANHFSKLHVMRAGPPIWVQPVVAPGGGGFAAMSVSDTAQAILTALGMKLRIR